MTVWLVIISTLISRFAFFMVWPFMAIILHRKFGLNEFEIGAFLALPTFIGVSVGFYVGYLSDKFGRRKIILLGLVINILAMLTIGVAQSPVLLMAGMIVQSIARGMVENPGKALMTDMLKDRAVKDMALHMRYFSLNIGAAFGPLVGISIGLTGQQTTFFVVAAAYGIYLLAASMVFRKESPLTHAKMQQDHTISQVIGILGRDHAFLLFVLASLLAFVAYAQIDVGLLQYLRVVDFPDIVGFYALLIFVNGMTVLIFQFPLLKLLENIAPMHRAALGVVLFIVAFIGFTLSPVDMRAGFLISMFLLSIGEVILLPTLNIIVDRMAPEHLKGSYFGAAAFGAFGFSLAPLTGGFLLHQFGGTALWLSMAGLSCFVGFLFFLAQNLSARKLNA